MTMPRNQSAVAPAIPVTKKRPKQPDVQRQAWTEGEFRARWKFSRTKMLDMKAKGTGPRVIKFGGMNYVTLEDETYWRDNVYMKSVAAAPYGGVKLASKIAKAK